MGFTTKLSVDSYSCGRWILTAPLEYRAKNGELLQVPTGFITDLASIPRLLRIFFTVNGKHRKAAVLHDDLYTLQTRSRSKCDDLFLEAMQSCGVSYWKRYSMFWGVRVGGWLAWSAKK